MLRLALLARYSGSVISFRQLSRSSISLCEQSGEHHGGEGGILASSGNDEIRATIFSRGSKPAATPCRPG